jgi:hypothetical protein
MQFFNMEHNENKNGVLYRTLGRYDYMNVVIK